MNQKFPGDFMSNKQKDRKTKKQKQRKMKIKKQSLARQATMIPSVEEKVDYALECLEEGNIREGKRILDKLRRPHQNHHYVQFALGNLAVKNQHMEEAVKWFGKAADSSPDFIEAHYNLGVAYKELLDIPMMLKAFKHVVDFGEPEHVIVISAREVVDKFIKSLNETDGISLEEYFTANDYFQKAMDFMTSKELDQAVTAFLHSIEIHPSLPQPHGNLGICYALQGKKQEALASFSRALELDPNYEPAILHKAMVESLEEGESLNRDVKIIEYYKDYSLNNRSYFEDYAKWNGVEL